MNIEEERKAFEIAFQVPPRLDFDSNEGVYTTDASNGTWLYNSCITMNIRMQGWLAAKKHAEEMAKRPVTIEQSFPKSSGVWTLIDNAGNDFPYDFRSAEEARVWATSNGYRVIEEEKQKPNSVPISHGLGVYVNTNPCPSCGCDNDLYGCFCEVPK